MKDLKIMTGVIMVLVFAGLAAALPAVHENTGLISNKKSARRISRPTSMNSLPETSSQGKLEPVTEGVWGGQSVSFTVEKDSVRIEFDCAEGAIPRQLKVDKNGMFRVDGTFTRHSPGPVRRDNQPQPEPAIYNGKVTGNSMTLKVTLVKNNESAGEFTTTRGKTPTLFRCY
jgi:hypothetical protein